MTEQILSELCVALSHEQQELIAGGVDFDLAGSNFANRLANLQGAVRSGPDGSSANSTGELTATNTAAQDLLGLGAAQVPDVDALGAAPILNGAGNNSNNE
ncbi:CTB family bacteriocin [Anabaena sp. CS-542/02]|uniref:CTB family bacteriocin n=1 Tax=Anabaena sp. CS-542/02 TaxID=3021719 RepID=UPI00232EFF3F|nr:CTB family bacteriocin [Anabaena sp. CS-542/02]MDB9445762.1 CTB family bacteriocin [Anabaena sp. CS-542/02]